MERPPDSSARHQRILMGTKQELAGVASVPELLEIDKEIGRPYMADPLLFNSQAWSRKLELPWVISEMAPVDGLSVLDIGSGTSALPVYLRRKGAKVVSVDPEVIHGISREGVRTVQAALPRLPFRDGAFDVVTCVSVLEHIPLNLGDLVAELCRIARKTVLLTFDVALSPLAVVGLSSIELRAIASSMNAHLVFPDDVLTPEEPELRIWVRDIGVCLVRLDRRQEGWPEIRFGRVQGAAIRFHRVAQLWVGKARKHGLRIRDSVRRMAD